MIDGRSRRAMSPPIRSPAGISDPVPGEGGLCRSTFDPRCSACRSDSRRPWPDRLVEDASNRAVLGIDLRRPGFEIDPVGRAEESSESTTATGSSTSSRSFTAVVGGARTRPR